MKKIKRIMSLFLIVSLVIGQELPSALAVTGEESGGPVYSSINNVLEDKENISSTVRFDTNGGLLTVSEKVVTYGSTYGTLPTPMKEGYTFNGWYTSASGGTQITEATTVNLQNDHSIFAQWNPIRTIIYFNSNGGLLKESSKDVSFGSIYGTLPTPSLADYNFMGWYTAPSGGELVTAGSIVNITSSTMLYARWTGERVNVTFNPNGGFVSETSKTVYYGDIYDVLPIPVRDGYQFMGWYVSGDENIVKPSSMVLYKTNHTLYASWSQENYNITFHADGGEVNPKSKVVYSGNEYGTLPTPKKKGHIFLGWFTSFSSDARQVNSSDIFNESESIILYAHWKANEHVVHLKGNGATLPKTSIIVSYGGTYGELPIPTLDNYTFEGWYTNPVFGSEAKSNTVVKTNDEETLYARWTGNVQTVYFDTNGGTTATKDKEVYYGMNYGVLPNPSRTGYTFEGWYSTPNGTKEVTSNDTVRLTAPKTLYARWTVKQPTITFDGKGGYVIANGEKNTKYVSTLSYGSAFGELPNAVREGYTFDGWYTSSTSGSEIYSTTINTATSSDTIYAHWTGNTYTTKFNGNLGYVSATSLNYIYGESYDFLPTPERAHYTFDGWYTEKVGGTKISASSTVKILGTQTLYAHWTGVKSRVYFDGYGGYTPITSFYVNYNDTYGTLPVASKTGYDFLGWYTDPLGGVQVKDSDIVKITSNQTLYARWVIKSLVITFDVNGGNGSNSSRVLNYGDPYGSLPTPSRLGYTFTGWYTTKTGGTQVTTNKAVNANANQTIYAHWEGESFYVYFNPTGGTVSESSKLVTNGKLYGTLKSPTRSGYTFGGWFTEVSGGIKVTSSSKVDLRGTSTLYAHWTKEVYTVNFNANGGTVTPTSTTVLKGTSYSDFPTPVRDGYSFKGWYSSSGTSGTLITYTTVADTLYAHWVGNEYPIFFDGNGGTATASSKYVVYGQAYGTLPTAYKPYNTFSGWYTTPEGGYVRSATSVVNFKEPLTLYARYKGISSKITYDSNGGNKITTTKTVYCGSPYGTLTTPTRTGYIFDGWHTYPVGGDLITLESIVQAMNNHSLYAHWTVRKPIITFNANGGWVIENGYKVPSMEVVKTYGDYYGALPLASKIGYTFDGWSTSSTGTTRITENTMISVISSDTLYARWIGNSYEVSFDPNGGSIAQSSVVVTHGDKYGTLPTPVMTGYTFTGWYTEVTGGTKITATTIVEIIGGKTLYAQWKEDTIKVSFNGNGGNMVINDATVSSTTRSLYYNGTYGHTSGRLPSPSRAGYLFDGWYTDIEGGYEITQGTNVSITESQTLYAHWKPKGVSVVFDENGGNPVADRSEVYYGDLYGMLPTPVRAHYNFLGWSKSKTGSTRIYEDTKVTNSSEIMLYAHWEPELITVTLDTNGSGTSTVGSIYPNYEGTYGSLPTPVRANHIFAGWYSEREGGYKVDKNSEVFIPVDHTLYAHWEENFIGISFVSNGYTLPTKYVKNNQPYGELPVPSMIGYHFVGWYTQVTGGGLVSATDMVDLTSNQILYAQWTAKAPTVVFYGNGGNLKQTTKTVTYGGAYGELPVPTLAHYTFNGWYTSLYGTTQITSTSVSSQVDTQILYAQWTPQKYTTTYDGNGGIVSGSSKVVTYDSTYGTLPTPSYAGYDFLGWYTSPSGGTLIKSSTKVTTGGDHTLYARWKGKPCTVTFNPNGGTVTTNEITVYQNENFGELPTPTRTGYTFIGWYTALEGGNLVSARDTVTTYGPITLYAHWSVKNLIVTLDANGGVVDTETITVPYGGVYGELPIPTLEHWTFDGWYTDPLEGIQILESDSVLADGSFTLYAHWTLYGEVTESLDELLVEYLDEYLTNRILPELIESGWGIDSIDDISMTDDHDGDGLTLDQEYRNNTDPFNADTDMDGLTDYEELMVYGTNPLIYDTDGDGLGDGSEVSLGLNPLVDDTDDDGIIDSAEIITQSVDLEIFEAFDIKNTMVKPSIEMTGSGDYYGKIYALPLKDYPVIDELGCVVGDAFEFLHDESLSFEKSVLTFTISDTILDNTPLEDLAIAYYDYDNDVLELLETTYAVSGGAITVESLSSNGISANDVPISGMSIDAVSGSAITASIRSHSEKYNTISAEVDHYSTYMVVNKQQYYNRSNTAGKTTQSSGTFVIRLSNGSYVRVLKDPALKDRSIDSDGDGLCDVDELGFRYFAQLPGSSSAVETWTYHTNPASMDTDKDGYKDNQDNRDNTPVYVDITKHSIKPYNMMMNGDNYFIDIHFNKYPYCTLHNKGEYVLQAERWLSNLGLISKVNGKYGYEDIRAVAYLQKKYNVGSNGIIDNKTYWLLWALDDINSHKNDVKLGKKTQVELDAYNASIMYRLTQPQYQNPDYTQDYYMFYYNMMLNHMLVGTQSLTTILSLFPGGEIFDVAMFLNHVANYKEGDQALIIADLAALGIDVAAEFADEIIDALKRAKRAAVKLKKAGIDLELFKELIDSGKKYNADNIIAITKMPGGKLVWLETGNVTAGLVHIYNHADEFIMKGISKNQIPDFIMCALKKGEVVGYQGKGTGRPIYEVIYNGITQRVAITTGSNGFIVGANPVSLP